MPPSTPDCQQDATGASEGSAAARGTGIDDPGPLSGVDHLLMAVPVQDQSGFGVPGSQQGVAMSCRVGPVAMLDRNAAAAQRDPLGPLEVCQSVESERWPTPGRIVVAADRDKPSTVPGELREHFRVPNVTGVDHYVDLSGERKNARVHSPVGVGNKQDLGARRGSWFLHDRMHLNTQPLAQVAVSLVVVQLPNLSQSADADNRPAQGQRLGASDGPCRWQARASPAP